MYRKILSWLLTLAMVFTMIGGANINASGLEYSDMPDDWSTRAIESAVNNGLLNGADGQIMPKENLTRAQMATIINRAFGAENKADISSFNDVPNEAWFFDEMAKAVHMKTFMGSNNNLNPNDAITREQAFLVIARALKLKKSGEVLEGFNDLDQISEWAKDGVYSLIQNGYIKGSNGNINPKGNITRAEFAQLMDNIIKHYINEEGQYTELPEGNIMINVPGVTLKDVTVTGDLIIGDGVGEGDVTLENVEVEGRMIVRGGGENSILIKGNSKIKEITVSKVDGKIRVYAEDGTEVEVVNIDDGKDKVLLQGRFKSVVIQTDTEISIDDAKIDKITLQSPKSNITVGETSTIVDIEIEKEAEESSVKVDGTVTTLTTSASKTTVEGEGTLDTINAEEGSDDSVFTVPDAKVTAEANVLVNETEVKAGEEATINDEGTDVVVEDQPTSSGESSSGSTTVDVEGISLDKTSITIKLGEGTEIITATVNPSNASNKNINWESSDETIATVSGGVVTPVSEGNTTVKAITVDGGYEAVCEVKVAPADPDITNYSGTYDGLPHSITVINTISEDTVLYSTDGGTWSTNPEFTDVGNYTVYVKVENPNYEDRTSSGTVTITKRDITITAASDSKVYDGTELTNNGYNITNGILADGESLDSVTVIGTQTEAGSTSNVASGAVITEASSNDVTSNYNITYVDGNLDVTKATGDVLTINGYSNFYDGLAHSISVDNTIPGDIVYYSIDGGITWSTTNPEYTEAHVDGYIVDIKVENSNYEDRLGQGIVQIMPQMLNITADSNTKVYDGTELTENGYTDVGTIAPGQYIDSVTVTGSQKYVGSSLNTPSGAVIKDASSNDVTSNYSINYSNGTLTVTQSDVDLTVTANSDSKEYDGTSLTNSGFTVTEGNLLSGDYIEADITGSITEVGTTNNIISNITVKNNGVDVTENYNITSTNGTLQVNERPITITAASDYKVYDGAELTNNGYSITNGSLADGETLDSVAVTGSQTEAGSSPNVPSGAVITDASSNDVTSNYDITYSNGTLEVTKATGDALSVDGFTGTYDGLSHSITVKNTVLGDTVYYSTDGGTNWSTTNPEFTDVGDYTIDVKLENPNYEDRTSSGTVNISKRDITITAVNDSKVYDGTELTNSGYNIITGTLANGETLDSVIVTGSQKYVGNSSNVPSGAVITDTESNDVTSNYNITYINGTLTITEADISIEFTSASDSKIYDGTPLSNDGYTYVGDLIDGDVIQQVEIFRSITDVGTIDNTIGLIYIMNDGVDVTDNYFYGFTYFYGTLEVTKRPITITAASDSKVYDGTELTNSGYTITSGTLADGQSIDSITLVGSQTEVGTSANVVSGAVITDSSSNDVTANYDITYVYGTLTVEENEPTGILIDADSGSDFIGVLYTRDGMLYYNEVSSTGMWQGEVEIGTGFEGKIAVDSSDNSHIIYNNGLEEVFYTRLEGEIWSIPEIIVQGEYADLDIDGTDVLHIIYKEPGDNYNHVNYINNLTGIFESPIRLHTGEYWSSGTDISRKGYNDLRIKINEIGNYFTLVNQIYRYGESYTQKGNVIYKDEINTINSPIDYGYNAVTSVRKSMVHSGTSTHIALSRNDGNIYYALVENNSWSGDLLIGSGSLPSIGLNNQSKALVAYRSSLGKLNMAYEDNEFIILNNDGDSIEVNTGPIVISGAETFVLYTEANTNKIKIVSPEPPLQTSTPTITTLSQTVNVTSINIEGTAEPDSNITITGGSGTANGVADSSGNYNISVSLTADSTNSLSVTAQVPGKTVSNVVSVDITHVTPEPAPAASTLTPADGGIEVPTDVTVSIEFDRNVTILDGLSGIEIYNNTEASSVPEVNASFDGGNNKITITHGEFLENNNFTVTILANTVQNSEGTGNEEITWSFTTVTPGAEITINDVLQMGINETATASTAESGAGGWTSDMESVATIDATTGLITAKSMGTAIISYTTSDSGKTNSIEVDVYQQPDDVSSSLIFGDGTTLISSGTKQLTGFPETVNAGETRTFEIVDGTSDVISVDNNGLVTYVADGTKTIRYELKETATGMIFELGEASITTGLAPAPTILSTYPQDQASDVAMTDVFNVIFNENIEQAGDNLNGVSITYDSGTGIVGNILTTIDTLDPRVLNIAHDELQPGTLYTVTIPNGLVKRASQESLTNELLSFSFMTRYLEIQYYNPLAPISLDIDEHITDLQALKDSGKLPTEVVVVASENEGDIPIAATITDWIGVFDGTNPGPYTLTALWTMPEGYEDETDPIVVTLNIFVNTAQTELTYTLDLLDGSSTSIVGNTVELYYGYGYASNYTLEDTRRPVTIKKTGTGDITNLNIDISEPDKFGKWLDHDWQHPDGWTTTLNDDRSEEMFYVYAFEGLASGTHTATYTVTADNGISETFNVELIVS